MYHIITTSSEKGQGEKVVEAATEAGSKGGTITNCKGSESRTSKLFSMEMSLEEL